MSDLFSRREILLAEAISDVDQLLRRLEEVRPPLEETNAKLLSTVQALDAVTERFRGQIITLTLDAKDRASQQITAHSKASAANVVADVRSAASDAIRNALDEQLGSRLDQLSARVQALAEANKRSWWDRWPGLVLAVAVGAAATAGVLTTMAPGLTR